MRVFINLTILTNLMLIRAAFGLVLLLAGMEDATRRKVSDILTASLWVCVGLFNSDLVARTVVVLFGLVFLLNALHTHFRKEEAWGWADILIIPPYFGMMLAFGLSGVVLAIASIIFSSMLVMRKKEVPFVTNMALAYVIAFILWII